jgi:tRNA(Ile)-lysidine synthase TilS/MesJ
MTITYEKWHSDNKKDLEILEGKDLIVAFSGGKDSSVVLHFLDLARKSYNYNLEAGGIVIPEHVLTSAERNRINKYWESRGINILWHSVKDADKKLSEAPGKGMTPCLICNKTKKNELMDYFRRTKPSLEKVTMVVSYSLWDLVSATIEHITGGIYAETELSNAVQGKKTEDRFIEIAQRFYPLIKLKSGLSIFKPLIYYNDQDILETVKKNELPLTAPSCEHKEYRPKRGFALYYHRMDHHFNYEKVLKFAQDALMIPDKSTYSEMSTEVFLKEVI